MDQPGFDKRTAHFLQWFESLPGAQFSDSIAITDLRDRNAGRGIVALRDIPAQTVLFTIPRRGIINVETSELPKKIPSIFSDDNGNFEDTDCPQPLDSWSSLILVLMYEYLQGDSSPWKPYFDVLPASFETPMFWSGEDLNELQASALRSKIGKADAEKMFSSTLIPIIRGHSDIFESSQNLSDDELIQIAHRMGSTIMAYAFDLENDDDKEEDASDGWVEDRDGKSMMGMVPMADILNADAEFNAHVNHEEDSLSVTALRPIPAGEEILNYYGPHPNSELLRRYGYVTPKHSRYDVVEIPWDVVEAATGEQLGLSQDLFAKAREKLDEDEFEEVFVLERDSAGPSGEGTFISPASISEMPQDLQQQLKGFLKAISKLSPDSIADKRKRGEVQHGILAKTLQILESRYPTSVPQDMLLLNDENLPSRRRMAIQVRLGEKKLLQEAKELLAGSAGEADESGSAKRTRT